MHKEIVMEKWVNDPHLSINQKNIQNLCQKETLIKSNQTKILFISLKRVFDATFV